MLKEQDLLGERTLPEDSINVCDQNTSKCRFLLLVNRIPAKS